LKILIIKKVEKCYNINKIEKTTHKKKIMKM